jgi:hypothetical protein
MHSDHAELQDVRFEVTQEKAPHVECRKEQTQTILLAERSFHALGISKPNGFSLPNGRNVLSCHLLCLPYQPKIECRNSWRVLISNRG